MQQVRCVVLACVLSLGLSGCVSLSDIVAFFGGSVEDAVGLPSYRVGDSFTFGSPSVTWRIVAIEDRRITWRSDKGDEQVTGRNPLLPTLGWRSERLGSGQRIISDKVGNLFPMKVGARTAFKAAVTTDKPPYGWTFNWQCEVLDRQQVSGPTGALDAFKVGCGRDVADEMVFFYAPSIGHYVMKTDRPAGERAGRVRHLVAYERINEDGNLERIAFARTPNPGHAQRDRISERTDASSDNSGTSSITIERGVPTSESVRVADKGRIERQARRLLSRERTAVEPGPEGSEGARDQVAMVSDSVVSPSAGENDEVGSRAGAIGPGGTTSGAARYSLVVLRTPDFPPRPKPNPRIEEKDRRTVAKVTEPSQPAQAEALASVTDIPLATARTDAKPFDVSFVKKAHAAPEKDTELVRQAREKALHSPGMGDEAMLAVRSERVVQDVEAEKAEKKRAAAVVPVGIKKQVFPVPGKSRTRASVDGSGQVSTRSETPDEYQVKKFFGAHLGTFLDPRKAFVGWQYIYRAHEDLLAGLQPRIRRHDLGEKGVRYKLRVTPFVDGAAAQSLCDKLEARGKYCRVTHE